MSNGARHALGVIAGLILTPVLAAGLSYGSSEVIITWQRTLATSWIGIGVVAACGVLLALMAGSRLSPVASLIAGLAFTLVGVASPVAQTLRLDWPVVPAGMPRWLPSWLAMGYSTLMYSGIFLFLGVALLVASMFPSRWRSRRPAPVPQQSYTPAEPYRQPDAFQQPAYHQQPDPFQPPPEPYRPQPEPYQPQQYPPQAQPQQPLAQPQHFTPQQVTPQQVKPTQHLPTFPAQPPEDPEDSTRPMNRD
ncbi:hypothetical protein ACIBG8_36155 [Nonomuraea sp. NPDC050556]|uniref:hypothetical protein n=1 Tax=Nonomuraea sp. NPDC050556 TaxID=3364369 RepID=UPI0037AB0307